MSAALLEPHAAWLIDLDGTLYWAPPVKLAMAAELALGGWAVLRPLKRFREQHEVLRREGWSSDASPYDEQLERSARELGLARRELEELVIEWMQERPRRWIRAFRRRGLLQEIARFREQGGRTALVSDYPARRKLEALAGLVDFDVVVAAGEAGGPTRLKPAPDGYLAAAAALGVEPSRCLVVGDRLDADGRAAEQAGMSFRRV